MFKTIVTNATLSANRAVSTAKDNRYIRLIKPEMLAHDLVANANSKASGVFVCLGAENTADMGVIYKYADVSSIEAQELYSVYAEGINLEPKKGKGSKAHNQKIADAKEALDILMSKGFYSILNFHVKPNNVYGSTIGTSYKYGVKYTDIVTMFGKCNENRVNGNRYYNYSTLGFGNVEKLIKNLSGKIAKVNADNFYAFQEACAQFINDNADAFKFINETEKAIREISKSEDRDYSSIDGKALAAAKSSAAKELINIAMQFPFAANAVGGNVKLFA